MAGPRAGGLPGDLSIVLLLSFLVGLAVAMCWIFAEVPTLSDDPFRLMVFGVMACVSVVIVILVVVRRFIRFEIDKGESIVLLFMLFSMFTASIDLCISSSLLHFTHLGDFYVARGEEYFSTPAGTMCLIWDGTIHLTLQGLVVRNLLQQRRYAPYLLVWSGSVVASMPPLLIGAATGSFAGRIHAATALNIPWIFVPVGIGALAFRVLDKQQDNKGGRGNNKNSTVNHTKEGVSWIPVALHTAVILVYSLRMLVALRSPTMPAVWWRSVEPILAAGNEPSGFLAVQALMAFFWFVPWHAFAIYARVADISSGYVLGWSLLLLGAELQHEALHLFSSLLVATPSGLTWASILPSASAQMWFGIANACVVFSSIVRCCAKPKLKQT